MHRILLRQPQSATHTWGYFVESTHGFRWLCGHILGVRYGPQSRALRCSMWCKSSGVVAYGLGRHRRCSRAKRGEEIWVVLPQMFDQLAWAVVLSSEIIKWAAETRAFRTTRSIGGHLSKVNRTMENATVRLARSRLYLGGQQCVEIGVEKDVDWRQRHPGSVPHAVRPIDQSYGRLSQTQLTN